MKKTKDQGKKRMSRFSKTPLLLFGAVFAVIGSVILFQANAATSGTYYVATSGSDSNAGTAAAPWKTIQKGIGSLSAGDTLIVKGGTYTGTVTGSPSGTASSRITMKAATGERPILNALVRLSGANYFTWDGVDVQWPSSASSSDHMFKMTGGTGWRVTNSEIWGAHSYAGILVAGTPSGWSIDHNYIHDTYPSNSSNQDHLIYVNGGTGGGIIERNIFANSANGRGVKVGPPSGGSSPIGNVTIRYNTFYNNTGPSNVQLSYGASNNHIYRNIMVKSGATNITAYNLNGTGNDATDNIGWDSSAVMDKAAGLTDKGGNVHADPQLNLSTFKPGNSAYTSYGRYAPGDNSPSPTPTPTPTPPPPTTTPDTQAPTVPANVQAFAASPTELDLTWNASTDNKAVTGYNIYRNGSTTAIKVGAVTSFKNAGLTANTSYSYQLEAFDAAGNKSAKSAAITMKTPPASTTTGDTTAPTVAITAPANNASVSGTVAITATASDNVGVAKVEVRVDGALKATLTSSPYTYSWNTSGLTGGHTIDVRAVDAAGNAKLVSATVTTNATSTPPTTTLGKPTGLVATAISETQINLTWNLQSTYRYDIYRDGVKVGATSSDNKYGDTYKLQAGTAYNYYIIARDESGGVSPQSDTVVGKTKGVRGTTSTSVGTLTGVVKGSDGIVIKGAKVSIKVGSSTVSAITNASGVYTLSNVPADSYPIVYSASGYTTKNDNVTVLAGVVKTKNVTLNK